MPKERTGDRPARKVKRPVRDTLRQPNGDSFASGIRGDAHLKTLLARTGSPSLSDYLKTSGHSPPAIRYASNRRFREANRKTTTLHAGLFRRLAE